MNLASNAKLLTSIAALGTLGSGFRWHTSVYADKLDDATGVVGGDLYVRAKGDPLLGINDLRALATEIVARGVRTIDGRVVIDGAYFDDAVEPPHYDEQKTERAGFRAPVASFGVSRSSINVVVVAEPGGGATVKLEPDAGDYVKIVKDEVVSVTEGRTRIRVDSIPKRDHLELKVSGQIRAAEGAYEVRKRIDDPARFAAEVFRKALEAQGVRIRGRSFGTGIVPPTAKMLASHESPTLGDVLRAMNKWSDNYVAECVLKTLGAETRATPGPATWADGTTAVRAYLAKLGMPAAGYRADNGSGLFGASEVSAHQMTTLLRAAFKDYRIGPDLVASLPIGGVDGTLAKRWHGRGAKGRVRAKTGTLDKVTTLAGYVGFDGGHQLAFAILINDVPPGQRPAARSVADDMIDALVAYLAP
jgi:D-alanyl-D-alanine carboxypeptidase/D-alanyl-D-alanine-endopeptidase (penicillin-binding protein 4)